MEIFSDYWKDRVKTYLKLYNNGYILKGITGNLRRSQKRILFNAAGRQGARITYGERYAEWMNSGTDTAPARKFIGHSASLNRKVSKAILSKLRKHFTTKYYIGR